MSDDQQTELLELRTKLKFLEEEAAMLRRRLEDSPSRVRALEERLLETKTQLSSAMAQNTKLADTLREAREQIVALKEQVEKLSAPPSGFGVFLGVHDEDTVRRLAEETIQALREIVEHCAEPGAGGCTPSDFPLAGLDQGRSGG
jgi:septal ring factor EnvC (AmiA/AmiB activator)